MDSLEEIIKVIGGIIFAAIYLFGGQIFKSKDDEERPTSLPRQNGDEDTADDYEARQRQIQEAIRRKILERRQAAGSAPTRPEPVAAQREQRKEVVERQEQTQQQLPHVEQVPEPVPVDSPFYWDALDNAYAQQMDERLQAIEATKRRAEALKYQADTLRASSSGASRVAKRRVRGGVLSGSVRSTLCDPAAARAAFIYGEVLGKPVSARASGSGVE